MTFASVLVSRTRNLFPSRRPFTKLAPLGATLGLIGAGAAGALAQAAPDRAAAATINFSKLARRETSALLPAQPSRWIPAPIPAPPAPAVSGGQTQAAPFSWSGGLADTAATTTFTPQLSTNFLALMDNHTAAPPDTMGAVGPNHLMVTLNSQVAVQSRGGQSWSTMSLPTFWASLGVSAVYDTRVAYDSMVDRWIFVTLANPHTNTSAILIATSTSPDPTGNWNLNAIPINPAPGLTNDVWADYPNLGFNGHWVAVTANLIGVVSNNFVRSEIFAFDQQKLFAGAGPSFARTNDFEFTLVPAVTFDPGETNLYLVSEYPTVQLGNQQLRVTRLSGLVGQETYETNGVITSPVGAWNFSPGNTNFAPQPGTDIRISCNDSRIQNAVFRNGSLWCAQTVFLPAGTNVNHSAVQWWQLATNAVILQRGRLEDTNAVINYAFPSLAVNRNNDVLIGYSKFASNQYASAGYACRLSGDLTNTLQPDTLLKAGLAPYRNGNQTATNGPNADAQTEDVGENRWGDFSATVVDPLNDTDMWTIQEYADLPDSVADRWGTWWGYVRFQPPTPPVNDLFSSRIQLSGATVATTGSNAEASVEPGEPQHAHEPGGRSVWWTWTAPASGWVTLNTEGSDFDTLLAVYTGSSVTNLAEVASDDDSGTNLTSRVTFVASAGMNYQIAVDGYAGFEGNIRLNLTMSPADFPPTVSITSPTNGTTVVETSTVTINANADDRDGTVTKVEFLNGKTKLGEVTTPPYTFDLTNVAPGSYALIARATDNHGIAESSSLATLTVVPTNFPPVAAMISPTNDAVFIAPASIALTITATDRDDTVSKLQLFLGGTELAEAGAASAVFNLSVANPGQYTFSALAIDSQGATSAPVSVTLSVVLSAPPNDNFSNAIALTGLTVSTNGTNAGATKEPGEPDHAGNPGGRSVWWSWTAPDYGITTISTEGSTFDTMLAVYTGAALTNLSLVASNDDRSFTDPTSLVTFLAHRGTTYQIAVDGYRNTNGFVASGQVALGISLIPSNLPPSVTLTGPVILSTFIAPANITLQADASDVDGSISRVDFFAAATNKLGSASAPPYDFSWTNVSAGTYVLTAQAVDDQGAVTTSGSVTIKVFPRPGRLTSPGLTTQRTFQLLLTGDPGFGYNIETSTNLTVWGALTNLLVGSNGTASLIDSASTNSRGRFYRAVLPE